MALNKKMQEDIESDTTFKFCIRTLVSDRMALGDDKRIEAIELRKAIFSLIRNWLVFNGHNFSNKASLEFHGSTVYFVDNDKYVAI